MFSLYIHLFIFSYQIYCTAHESMNCKELSVHHGRWVLHTVGIQSLSADLPSSVNSSHSRPVLWQRLETVYRTKCEGVS